MRELQAIRHIYVVTLDRDLWKDYRMTWHSHATVIDSNRFQQNEIMFHYVPFVDMCEKLDGVAAWQIVGYYIVFECLPQYMQDAIDLAIKNSRCIESYIELP